jgi:hypothetical protein
LEIAIGEIIAPSQPPPQGEEKRAKAQNIFLINNLPLLVLPLGGVRGGSKNLIK